MFAKQRWHEAAGKRKKRNNLIIMFNVSAQREGRHIMSFLIKFLNSVFLL